MNVCNHLIEKEGKTMRMKTSAILLLSLSILAICGAGCTDSGKYALSGKVGTLGLGGEFATALAPDINARIGLNGISFDVHDEDVKDIDYDADVDLRSFSVLLDWYVFDDAFRVSGGIMAMDNELHLKARPDTNIEIGDLYFTPEQVGTLRGSVEDKEVAPYLGIGWGNPFTAHRRWGLTCDLGVAFINSPDVTLTATGGTNPPQLEGQLAKEREDIRDSFHDFKLYPVIAVSFYYRF
jgi:hypothetical protein